MNTELSFLDKFSLGVLKRECTSEVHKGPGRPSHINIELYKEYETELSSLEAIINKMIENKVALWSTLRSNSLTY